MSKSFSPSTVSPGGTVTLEFTLELGDSPGDATNIAFSDDLNAALSGLAAVGLPANNVCGAGSQLSGTTNLSFTGGSLVAGSSCTFSVTLQVPLAAVAGNYTNTTSNVTATVLGNLVTGNQPASDVLVVAALTFSKSFTNDPVAPGATVNLQFVINNATPASSATAITFTDDLDATLSGLAAVGPLPTNPCGAGSVLSGTSLLSLTGGNLAALASCTFNVPLQVPAGAATGEYQNTTSAITGTVGGSPVTGNAASDKLLIVIPAPDLTVSKTNTVGGATTLGNTWSWRSTISNGGNAPANFADGQTIYTDTMPSIDISYGALSIGSASGITGTINCTLSGGNVILCTASGAVSIAVSGSFRVDVTATPSAAGHFTNPTGGLARVDPDNNVAESNEANNDSNSDSVVVTAMPDLTVGKTNTVSGATTLGNTWAWRSTISNGGNAPANFSNGQTIYTDTMPSTNVSYGAPSIGSQSGITGAINCALSGANVILCTASGAVAIAAPGSFRVDVTATPSASGTFTNPTGGPARVDPNNNVAESNEANNDSNSDNVVVSPIVSFTGPSATGTGTITASFTSGDTGCSYTVSQYIGAPPGVLPVPPTLPAPGTAFPHGLFSFTVAGCTPGATLNFTIVYPQALPPGTQYWKYGPTSTDATPHWYVLPTVISGNTITFSIIDGGLGDDDLVANGTIVDQGGPGALTVPIPALSVWALALLALLLLGFSAQRARKKP